jgi:hypothetical protein
MRPTPSRFHPERLRISQEVPLIYIPIPHGTKCPNPPSQPLLGRMGYSIPRHSPSRPRPVAICYGQVFFVLAFAECSTVTAGAVRIPRVSVPIRTNRCFSLLLVPINCGSAVQTARLYQRYATRCLQEARTTPDSQQKAFHIEMAQAWQRLADQVKVMGTAHTSSSAPDPGD